jgi:hypothetical protein
MSGQPGGTKHSHLRLDAMAAILTARPELADAFPLAEGLTAGSRWSA